MPVGYYDTDSLLQSIVVRAAVPISQITFSNDDLLRFAQEEIDLKIVPSILAVKEEFYVTIQNYPLVANQSGYDIPYRAIGQKVRSVYYQQNSNTLVPLAQIPIERIPDYSIDGFPYRYAAVYVQDDQIFLAPEVQGNPSGSLVVRYYLKPNQLVLMKRGAQIRSIDRTTGTIEVKIGATNTNQVPQNININTEVDFIQSRPGHKTFAFDVQPVSVNTQAGLITFDPADIPSRLRVGDWINTAGETVIPQIPSELHVMLAQAVACRVLEAIGDTQDLQNAAAKLQEMEQKLLNVIDSRIEAPGKKIVPLNGLLSGGRLNRRRIF